MANELFKQEVSCLFVTQTDGEIAKVLLMSKDGEHWHFPQEKVLEDGSGRPLETFQEAIVRLCSVFDITSTEEDTFLEVTREHKSHKGIQTTYHIFTTDPKNLLDAELKSNGVKYVWTDKPHTFKLNACTREELVRYGFHSD
jgi:hypothetical protein